MIDEQYKEIILESLKEYRRSYIDNIHPMDEYDEAHEKKVNNIDEAIKYLETEG